MDNQQQNELFKTLGNIETGIENLKESIVELKEDQKESVNKLEKRVEKVEVLTTNLRVKMASAAGAGGVISVLVTEIFKRAGGQ